MATLKVVLPKGWTKLPIGKAARPADVASAVGITSGDAALWAEVVQAAAAVQHGAEVGRACLAASYTQLIEGVPIGAGMMVSTLDGVELDLGQSELLWRADASWTVEGRLSLGSGPGLLRQRVTVLDDYALGNAEVFAAQVLITPLDGHPPIVVSFSSPNVDLREVLLRLFLAICSSIRVSGD